MGLGIATGAKCGGGANPLLLDLVHEASIVAGQSSFNFSAANFGSEAVDREIIVCVSQRRNAAVNIASASIGGIAADLWVNNASNPISAHIISANVPTGASGDVIVNMSSGASAGMSVKVFRMSGHVSRVPAPNFVAGSGVLTINQSIAARSAAVGNFVGGNATVTWGGSSGITKVGADVSFATTGDAVQSAASKLFVAAAGPVDFSASSSGNERLALCVWQ